MENNAIITKNNGVVPFGIIFNGELIAHVSSLETTGLFKGCWQELNLYLTESGAYICQRVYRSQMEGERDAYSGEACKDHNAVIKFFGFDCLARQLYEESGINFSEAQS